MALTTARLKKLGKFASPTAFVTKSAISQAQNLSLQKFGYDFTGLFFRLFIFFGLAFVFAKFMESVILTRGGFITFANFLGWKIPQSDQLPDTIKKLFGDGIQGFKFWDIIKIIGMVLVVYEYFEFKNQKNELDQSVNPLTTGVFLLLVIMLGVTTIPELVKRVKATDFNLDSMR